MVQQLYTARLVTCARLAFTTLAVTCGLSVRPAEADTANVGTTTTVVPPLTLSQPAEMRFGTIIPSGAAGSVTLVLPAALSATPPTTATPTIIGSRTSTAAITLVGGTTCTATVLCGAGSVLVAGPVSGTFGTVTLPATVTLTSGANTMVADTLTKRYGAEATAGVITGLGAFSATGTATIVFAGRIVVGATQAAGTYTGTMIVTVDY
jgi:Mat/Ecp fimbriae major subunit